MRQGPLPAILFYFLFLASPAWAAPAAQPATVTITGIMLSPQGAVANGTVYAYRDYRQGRRSHPDYRSRPGDKTGEYRLTLPPGRYYLTAEADGNGAPLFAYHGLNPITVRDSQWIPLFLQAETVAVCGSGFQGIGGRLLYHGRPLDSGSVSVYAVNDTPYRGMGLLTNTLDPDGRFWFDLEPGSYMVIGRRRSAPDAIGPLHDGDFFCFTAANPIRLRPATSCRVDLNCYPRNRIGDFLRPGAPDPRGGKETARRQTSLEKEAAKAAVPGAAGGVPVVIAGRVTDTDNQPLAGLTVAAYSAAGHPLFEMYVLRFKTPYMTRTGADGRFRLELGAGTYYLVARERLAEAPVAGEYYALYEGSANHSLTVHGGEARSGIQLIAAPIMP